MRRVAEIDPLHDLGPHHRQLLRAFLEEPLGAGAARGRDYREPGPIRAVVQAHSLESLARVRERAEHLAPVGDLEPAACGVEGEAVLLRAIGVFEAQPESVDLSNRGDLAVPEVDLLFLAAQHPDREQEHLRARPAYRDAQFPPLPQPCGTDRRGLGRHGEGHAGHGDGLPKGPVRHVHRTEQRANVDARGAREIDRGEALEPAASLVRQHILRE